MMDMARAEQLQCEAREAQVPGLGALMINAWILDALITEYLAMRAIVEALAAKNPIEWDEIEALDGRPGYRCRYCGSLNPSDDPKSFIHIVTCEWCDAVALVGPASERTEAG